MESCCDPTVSIGGILKSIDGNIRVGKSDFFLTEACEYTNSFLNFYPKYALILNIEEDHMDFFKNRCGFCGVVRIIVHNGDTAQVSFMFKTSGGSAKMCKRCPGRFKGQLHFQRKGACGNGVPADGTLIINGEIENYQEITEDLACKIVTYGLSKL